MSCDSKDLVPTAIRAVRLHEISSVAGIHASALPEDFFPCLGINFLEDYYRYSLELEERNEVRLIGVFDGERLIGFCQITFNSISALRLLRASNVMRILCLIFLRPKVFVNGLIQFFYSAEPTEGGAEIAFIAVEPDYQGKGIGNMLISKAMAECRDKKLAWLVTKTANRHLSLFYQKQLKATVIRSFSAVGKDYEILRWPVNP